MKDEQKSKSQLITELKALRLQLANEESLLEKVVAEDVIRKNQSENALRIEKAKLNSILETMADGVYIVDKHYNIQYVNAALKKDFGEYEGRKCYEYFHRKRMACEWCKNSEVHKGKAVRWEWYSEKNKRTYDLIDTPLKNFDGSISKLEIFRDITDKKEAEEELKKSKQKYESLYAMFRMMADNMPDLLWAKDIHKKYLFTNKALCEKLLLAHDTDEPIGKDDLFFAKRTREEHSDDSSWHTFGEICLDSDSDVMDSGQPQRYDEYGNVQGKFLYLDAYKAPIWNENKELIGTVGCGRIVTREKQIEQKLRESEQRYELATNAGQVGVWDWNLETGEVYVDPRLKTLMGYSDSSMGNSASDWGRLIHQDDLDLLRAKVDAHLEGSSPFFEVTHRMIPRDGRVFWLHVKGSAIRDSEGKPCRIVGTNIDITERKQAQDLLKRRTLDLGLLNSAGRALVSSLEQDQVLSTLLDEVQHLIGITACSIWLIDSKNGDLVCRESVSNGDERVCGEILQQSKVMAEWVVQHEKCLNVPDLQCASHPLEKLTQKDSLHLRSILCLSLQTKNGILGALHLGDITGNRFDSGDVHLVESLAALAAIAIENAHLYRQTREDARTKDLLLKEVNHRVKNNLAAITGMLYIEQRFTREHAVKRHHGALLHDLTNRIKGLSTVHQLLSDSNWSPLSFGELSGQVIDSALQVLPQDRKILVDVSSSAAVTVTPKDAHNLAIVVNELATNAIKYATSTRETTHINVTIVKEPDSEVIRFTFQDDGPGFPAAVLDSKNRRVGMYLMENTVCHSLRGQIAFSNDDGAVVSIQFTREME